MPRKSVKKKEPKAKKVAAPKIKKRYLENAPVEHYFILANGQPVKNIKELADLMEDLRDDIFSHHVNMDKNDFATWIKDIFHDIDLAKDLAGVKDKTQTRIVLYKHIIRKLS